MAVNIEELRGIASQRDRYKAQLNRIRNLNKQTSCIEAAVSSACDTLNSGTTSFVIYGEPQSGKTEMMICLTAKLLDDGHRIIIHLLNDSVQLLQQNLDRFQRSNLSPAARNFSDVLDPEYSFANGFHVIFCKKNASDLAKLNQKLERVGEKIIIDDEADFATPNALINKGDVTRINALIKQLIRHDGIYIGVTATPARLDLNNTFDNDNEKWVNFPPHEAYTGQDAFFPLDMSDVKFSLQTLPDADDSPKYLRDAIFRFLVRVAALNLSNGTDENFSMLSRVRDALWCAFSRLIITKQAGASLAMDLSHSRPHKAFSRAPIDPFDKFPLAVNQVLKNCIGRSERDRGPASRVSLGDARRLPLNDASIDLVLTSPPYLNAIDYMRCSKFSLVWMGYCVSELGAIRSDSVGAESGDHVARDNEDIKKIIHALKLSPKLASRHEAVLAHYIDDMRGAITEAARVLSPGGRAVYVVGENTVRGTFIPNAKIVSAVAELAGLTSSGRRARHLPANRRYLPPPISNAPDAMGARMRREVILSFSKAA